MATVVDLCNLSLGKLGDRAALTSIDPPEGSAQADHCARFWPIARDEALADNDWSFASTWDDTIARLDVDHPVWQYVYTLPTDCLVVRELRCTDGSSLLLDPNNPQFEMSTLSTGTLVLLSNYDLVALRFTRRVTDPTRYSPKMVAALVFLLASHLAGPVVKGKAGVQQAQAMYIAYQRVVAEAAVIDANQNSMRRDYTPGSIRARRGSWSDGIVQRGQERFSLPFWASS